MSVLNLPLSMVVSMSNEQLTTELYRLKRTRSPFWMWAVNGRMGIAPRTTSIMLIQEELRGRS